MNDEFAFWLLLLGLAVGAAAVWFVRGTIARQEDDLAEDERTVEAEWIGGTIERAGGVAPVALVEQILQLHREYLRGVPAELPAELPAAGPSAREADAQNGDGEPVAEPPAPEDHPTAG